ncbi:hypothetical protein Bbelb_255680 [Branchiostoma belcheri]|nr:hypothetical protein Bbelb_255680 [Branchiostoma belcheri]
MQYMEREWLGNSVWSVEEWSVYFQPIRTNNDLEGYHTRLNKQAQHSLGLYMLVGLLSREADYVNLQAKMVSMNRLTRYQRRPYRVLQSKIFTLFEQYYAGEVNTATYLRKVSRLKQALKSPGGETRRPRRCKSVESSTAVPNNTAILPLPEVRWSQMKNEQMRQLIPCYTKLLTGRGQPGPSDFIGPTAQTEAEAWTDPLDTSSPAGPVGSGGLPDSSFDTSSPAGSGGLPDSPTSSPAGSGGLPDSSFYTSSPAGSGGLPYSSLDTSSPAGSGGLPDSPTSSPAGSGGLPDSPTSSTVLPGQAGYLTPHSTPLALPGQAGYLTPRSTPLVLPGQAGYLTPPPLALPGQAGYLTPPPLALPGQTGYRLPHREVATTTEQAGQSHLGDISFFRGSSPEYKHRALTTTTYHHPFLPLDELSNPLVIATELTDRDFWILDFDNVLADLTKTTCMLALDEITASEFENDLGNITDSIESTFDLATFKRKRCASQGEQACRKVTADFMSDEEDSEVDGIKMKKVKRPSFVSPQLTDLCNTLQGVPLTTFGSVLPEAIHQVDTGYPGRQGHIPASCVSDLATDAEADSIHKFVASLSRRCYRQAENIMDRWEADKDMVPRKEKWE